MPYNTYTDQFTPWIPNHCAPQDSSQEPMSADRMCLMYTDMITEDFSQEDITEMNDLFVASLLANGWIQYIMFMSEDDNEELI